MKKSSTLQNYIDILTPYIALKSISTDPAYQAEIEETVTFLKELFMNGDFDVETIKGSTCNDIVFAQYHVSDDAKTVLIYGHYDVQPTVDQEWSHGKKDGFILEQDEERIYSRGVVDNKGQSLIHILTVLKLIAEGKLAHNVKFLIEGNEESGNADIAGLIEANKELLKADVILVSDGSIIASRPTLEKSLRGGFNCKVILTRPGEDLHSGLAGGTVANPLNVAGSIIGSLHDETNSIMVPGFYDDVPKLSEKDKLNIESLPTNNAVAREMELRCLKTRMSMSFFQAVGLEPAIEVTGIKGGYVGEGFANISPNKVEFRLNVRTAPGQNNAKLQSCLMAFIEERVHASLDYKIEMTDPYEGVMLDLDTPEAIHITNLLEKYYGGKVAINYVGGGIPVIKDFKDILGMDPILVPFGNTDCNMHGADENFEIDLIEKAFAFSEAFFSGK